MQPRLLTLSTLCMLAVSTAQAQDSTTYIHPPTGLRFPQELNGMLRDKPDIWERNGSVGITYRFKGEPASLTVIQQDSAGKPVDLGRLLQAAVTLQKAQGQKIQGITTGEIPARCESNATPTAVIYDIIEQGVQARYALRYRGYIVTMLLNLGPAKPPPAAALLSAVFKLNGMPCVVP